MGPSRKCGYRGARVCPPGGDNAEFDCGLQRLSGREVLRHAQLLCACLAMVMAVSSAAAQAPAPVTERLPPLKAAATEEVSGVLDEGAAGNAADGDSSAPYGWLVVRGQAGFNRALNQTINHQQRETPGGPVPSGTDLLMTEPSTAPSGARAGRGGAHRSADRHVPGQPLYQRRLLGPRGRDRRQHAAERR